MTDIHPEPPFGESEIKSEIKTAIDWNNVLIQASIAAMQGIQESGTLGLVSDVMPDELAKMSVRIGEAMVRELKSRTGDNGEKVKPK